MKNLKKFIALFSIILFISCNNSEDSTPIDTTAQEDDLVGTWSLTEITQDGTATATVQGVPVETNYTSFGKNIDAQIVFTQNPNNFTASGGFTSVVTVTLLGQSTTEEFPIVIDGVLNQGTWEVNQGVITVTQNSDSQAFNITELTDTRLKLEIELKQDVPIQGNTFSTKSVAKLTLIKQ